MERAPTMPRDRARLEEMVRMTSAVTMASSTREKAYPLENSTPRNVCLYTSRMNRPMRKATPSDQSISAMEIPWAN